MFMAFWNRKKEVNKATIEGVGNVQLFQPIDASLDLLKGYSPTFDSKFNSVALLKLYNEVGAVNSIINFIATRCGELPLTHVRYQSNGKKKILGETEALKVVQKLSIQNSVSAFLIHGNIPIWKLNVPAFDVPSRLEQLPSQFIYPIPQYHVGLQGVPATSADCRFNPVVRYHFNINGTYHVIPIEEMIYIKNINPNLSSTDYYSGMSPLYAATRSIDILSGLYDTINTVTQYKGALGFIKKISRPGQVDPLAGATEGKTWTDEYFAKYGMNQRKGQKPIGFTPYDLAWVKVDAPIRDFMPVELTTQQVGQLCNQFGISDVLFNNNSAATESNVKAAEVRFYENCAKPLMVTILDAISYGIGLDGKNEFIEADFSEVSCLQQDELSKYQAKQAASTHLLELYDSGLITKNQILEELGMPTNPDPEFDKLKEPQKPIDNGNPDTTIPQ